MPFFGLREVPVDRRERTVMFRLGHRAVGGDPVDLALEVRPPAGDVVFHDPMMSLPRLHR